MINKIKISAIFFALLVLLPATSHAVPDGKGNDLFTGNVGVGSLAPGQLLDVAGTIRMTSGGSLTFPDGSNQTTAYTGGGGSSQWITNGSVGIGTYNNVGIGTTTPQGAFVVTNGNVGIGTWVPSGTLDLGSGNITWGATTTSVTRFNGQTVGFGNTAGVVGSSAGIGGLAAAKGTYIGFSSNTNLSSVPAPDSLFSRLSLGVIGVGISTVGNFNGVFVAGNIGIGTFNTNNSALIVSSGNVGIGTTAPQGGLVVTNGNVGIGTWAPGAALSVMNGNVGIGTTVAPSMLYLLGSTPTVTLVDTAHNLKGYVAADAVGLDINYSNGTDSIIMGGPISFSTNGGSQGNFETNGGLWIGATRNTAVGNHNVLLEGNVGIGSFTNASSTLGLNGNMTIGVGTYYINNAAPTNGLTVQGNVGIGTWVPKGSLDVGGGTICLGGTCNSSWPGGSVNQWITNGSVGIGTYSNVGIGTTNPQDGFVVTSGNVGIGTWAPANTFQVGINNLFVDSNGNVGINGANTSLAPFNVKGTSTTNGVSAFRIYDSSSTSILSIRNDGNAYINVGKAWNTTGSDYAEYVKPKLGTSPYDYPKGALLCVAKDIPDTYGFCAGPNDAGVIGVVSTAPGVMGNSPEPNEKKEKLRPETHIALALAGRVPLLVSLENGPIHIGDRLTSSSRQNYAMKASQTARTIGVALENYVHQSKDEKILVYLNPELTIIQPSTAPEKSNGMVNHVVCWKTSTELGYCTTPQDANGACICK